MYALHLRASQHQRSERKNQAGLRVGSDITAATNQEREIRFAQRKSGFFNCLLRNKKGFIWHKRSKNGCLQFGMSHWTRANTEDCLFAARGNIKRASAGVRQFIDGPLGIHSHKPDEARERLVQLVGDVPRIQLFARTKAPGWSVWGRDVASDVTLESRIKQPTLFQAAPGLTPTRTRARDFASGLHHLLALA